MIDIQSFIELLCKKGPCIRQRESLSVVQERLDVLSGYIIQLIGADGCYRGGEKELEKKEEQGKSSHLVNHMNIGLLPIAGTLSYS